MGGLAASLRRVVAGLAAAFAVSLTPAQAQAPSAKPEMYDSCPGLIAGRAPHIVPAAVRRVALTPQQVRITYVRH